jgi:hypothetical protein
MSPEGGYHAERDSPEHRYLPGHKICQTEVTNSENKRLNTISVHKKKQNLNQNFVDCI